MSWLGKGRKKGGYSPAPASPAASPSHHYFDDVQGDEDAASPSSIPKSPRDMERQKKELKVKKKLREVEELERRREAGEQLEANQLKKLETRAELEEELRQLQPPPAKAAAPPRRPPASAALRAAKARTPSPVAPQPCLSITVEDVENELAMLELEGEAVKAQEEEEEKRAQEARQGKGAGKGGPHAAGQRSGGWGAGKAQQRLQLPGATSSPVAAPSTSLRATEAAAARASAWGTSPTSASSVSPASKPGSRCASPSTREERLMLPPQVSGEQIQSLRGDLQVWSSKFGARASVEGDLIVARFRHEGAAGAADRFGAVGVEAAMEELKAILRFTFGGGFSPGSRQSPGNSPRVGAGSPGGGRARPGARDRSPRDFDDLADPDSVFDCCDTDGSGNLDMHELRFALNAFGLFPNEEYIRDWMDGQDSLGRGEFRDLLKRKLNSAPSSMRRPRAIPYSRRGVSLGQLKALHSTFVESGWISERCDEFNLQKQDQIEAGKVFRLEANLYALDKYVIRPVTSPEPDAGPPVPQHLRDQARLPQASHKCSYSELVNPNGVLVDTFVSHFWGHPFADTMAALRRYAAQSHRNLSRVVAEDMVFWLCFLALNQHRAGEEVGSSPEEGPFNAALMQASRAVMILDDQVNPFRRIWCLFEVKRLTDLGKSLELICSLGPVSDLLERETPKAKNEASGYVRRIGAALEQVSAFKALASSQDDKYAIWHRVADPALRKMPLEVALKMNMFNESIFKRFDMVIRSLLAAPLFRASLRDGDAEAALRYIGMGAAFSAQDLEQLENICSEDLCSVQVSVKSYKDTVMWKLLHCAAYFGHAEAVENLLDRAADIEAKTRYGLTPLMQATRNGHADIAELLISRGACVDARNKERRTALHGAAHQGHHNTVERLLVNGADVNAIGSDGQTALHGACSSGHVEIAQLLLSHGANPISQNSEGLTPLHGAAKGNHVDVARTLLGIASAFTLVKKKTRRGHTSLDIAESEGHFEVADAIREVMGA